MGAIPDWILLVVTLALLAAAGVIAMPLLDAARRPLLARRRLQDGPAAAPHAGAGLWSTLSATLDALGRRFAPKDENEIRGLRLRLVNAGIFEPDAVRWFIGARILAIVLGGIAGAIGASFVADRTLLVLLAWIGCGVGIGFSGPSFWLDSRIKRLRRQYEVGFANMMDLLVVCVEAGMGVEAGLQRICDELRFTSPHLRHNLDILLTELRAGKQRASAFAGLGERLGIEEAAAFGRILVQSEELGASVAQTLRVSAGDLRQKRMFRAEEYAQSLPVRIVVPLGLFIFPAMLVVVTLPAILSVHEVLFSQ